MHKVTDEAELGEIVNLARKYLARYQPDSYRLVVDTANVLQEDDWYYVVVNPDRNDIRSYDYSSRLAEAEQDLEESEHRKILPVPAVPDRVRISDIEHPIGDWEHRS